MNHSSIIAHRGFWSTPDEKNSSIAFKRAFSKGYGVETDLRDLKGEIVISHNMPEGQEIKFEDLVKMLNGRPNTLALNIKADGIYDSVFKILNKYDVENYFTFDMSIPDLVCQTQYENVNVFTGMSDILNEPILLDRCTGVWLDSFYTDWYSEIEIESILSKNKKLCVVSPELHGRQHIDVWKLIKPYIDEICVCTDLPEAAEEYFYGKD